MKLHNLSGIATAACVLTACADAMGPQMRPVDSRALITANAQATRIPFAGYLYGCAETPPADQRITNGLVLHFQGAQNENQWVTREPLVDGIENNIVDAMINLKTGTGVAHARSILSPTAVMGTWEGTAKVKVGASGVSVHGVGSGTVNWPA